MTIINVLFEGIVHSTAETEAIGAHLAEKMLDSPKDLPPFVALYGDLGSGKTAFVRGFTSVIAPTAIVRSPTFTIVNEYRGGIRPIFHFDMYRIGDEDDLYSVGFYDYLSHGICLCEWSENIPYALPELYIKTDIARTNIDTPDERRISVCVVQNDAHLDG
ncbi:MAG: tRNA (adenosine(37)-N6)-threonylcarbamoyltransferase complex ATPase subunit type 1 TsaE [Clostridia bacterium]|nr:tRNA (adenosine(37)-N6)-threonylcarbamoyltransferase complex ATPase subunit type 1 TsaE [Clostridia bacterium]